MLRQWLRLFRLPLAPTALFDVTACTLFGLQVAGELGAWPAPMDWLQLLGTSLLIYCFGMAGNDWADRRRDASLYPDRALPSGDIQENVALVVILALGTGAVLLGGGPLGSTDAVYGAIFCAVAYNLAAKKHLVFGALTMGSVRFFNASIALSPLVVDDRAPWWILLAPACIGLYSAAIIVLSTTEDVDRPRRLIAARLMSIACFGGAGVLAWVGAGVPTLGGLLIALPVMTSTAFGVRPKPGPPRRQVLEMLLGLYFLSYVIATAADDGSFVVALAGLALALGAIYFTQWFIRRLARPRPDSPPPAAPAPEEAPRA